jgi:HSF-type DNA-binding
MTSALSETKTVQHSYKDHSRESESKADESKADEVNCHRSDQNFPVKLHYMLTELKEDGLSHIVSWQPHGRCFLVHDRKEFAERILPL